MSPSVSALLLLCAAVVALVRNASAKDGCSVRGKTYNAGEEFMDGCTMKCGCSTDGTGQYACVSACPPMVTEIEKTFKNCRYVFRHNDCCNYKLVCENEDKKQCDTEMTKWEDGHLVSKEEYMRTDDKCEPIEVHGSTQCFNTPPLVLIADNAFITNSSYTTGLLRRFNAGEANLKVDFQNQSYAVQNVSEKDGIALVILKDLLPTSPSLRPLNLPLSPAHCRRLTKDGCATILHGSLSDPSTHGVTAVNSATCRSAPDRSIFYLGVNLGCGFLEPIRTGNGVSARSDGIEYLVGLTVQEQFEVKFEDVYGATHCQRATSICNLIDWFDQFPGLKRVNGQKAVKPVSSKRAAHTCVNPE